MIMKRTVIITGATSGIGRSAAFRYAEKGYQLILCGRRAQRLQEVEEELQRTFQAAVQTLCFDIRDPEACAQAVSSIDRNRFPEMNILVNNAGLAAGFGPVDQGNYDDWNRMIDTNVKGLLHMSREIIPFMREQKSGHIINIGSTAGKDVYLNGNVYCATKFGVEALNQAMRIDLLPYGIKVTAINPGMAETEFSLVRFKGDEDRAKNVYAGINPLRAEDIADIAWYCATLPPHVCINDLTVTCLTQATSVYAIKEAERVKP